jgi:hypothetical protein
MERCHPQDWIITSLPIVDKYRQGYKIVQAHLLAYALFNDAVGIRGYGVSNSKTIIDWWIGKDTAGSESSLIWDSNLAFVWKDLRRPRNTSAKSVPRKTHQRRWTGQTKLFPSSAQPTSLYLARCICLMMKFTKENISSANDWRIPDSEWLRMRNGMGRKLEKFQSSQEKLCSTKSVT